MKEKNEEKGVSCSGESKGTKKLRVVDKMRDNPWIVSSIVLSILVLGFLFSNLTGDVTGRIVGVSQETAVNNFIAFAELKGIELEVTDVVEEDLYYSISFSTEDGDSYVYVSKDGENLISGVIPMTLEEEVGEEVVEIPTADVPVVELFVMTHCPYGTQAEKGFIPIIKLLKDVADLKIRYVHYFMHDPEYEETPRQICIREEQSEKYLDYLTCFLEGDGDDSSGYIPNGNDPSTCMQRVGVDEDIVNECVDSEKWKEYYDEDSVLSQSYGVSGSPSLVINGVIASSGRSPSAYLDTVCASGFNEVPQEECMSEVSSETPSVYFGWGESGSPASSDTLCG
ncbi:MAG: hypothetical protein OQK82_06225 [Candidatus Pacearchaeota archaeon]|nr:hypothetical protein [Candidatus Pacearchaeota archaeon]